ncbi:carbamoyltransferase HypF [uncultured Mitsuokella sp.]|uniref:carbamoyltransferase HypF n=1 Tax=uncultured Mitsuokella sp. TaxID=453120 RepID=UPI00266FF7B1|nr:carbamoyltransferase HypF [uncultured Mitsuokella sp.]
MTRLNIKIYGIVQGVGFRPFVSRLAAAHDIRGSVCNKGPYVEVLAEGTEKDLRSFRQGLRTEAPERAAILKIDAQEVPAAEIAAPFTSFDIIESAKERGDIFVSPDIATCDKCRAELFDPHDRRYLHPFINCTACGPRLTILEAMPYDRERTSMREFPMCEKCHEEYVTPASRRYDAQPVCCNDCGPEVYLLGHEDIRGAEAITKTRAAIIAGGLVAIKGIGGFHLCCDATSETAVRRLRELKHRPQKPFAVMMRDMKSVEKACELQDGQKEMMTGHQKPILLLRRKKESPLAESIAPGNPKVGVMLPYAPVQMLLFDYPDGLTMPDMLVMTSGNPSGAPICHNDKEAAETLLPMCGLILSHNRRIRLRADDSVMDWFEGRPYMIRRSRGFAPLPFMLSTPLNGQVLGIGGELKNTFCLASNHLYYPSPYIGDMSDLRTVLALKDSVGLMSSLLENQPQLIACDLHPRYNTTAVAEELSKNMGVPLLKVQHHYAHILSCMVENDWQAPVIGVSFDGTGYGTDGTIWGSEFLLADYQGFKRLGSIMPFQQAGGDRASREGWRIAVSLLREGRSHEAWQHTAQELGLCTEQEFKAQSFMLEKNINCIESTSAGRLFDGVSALLGLRRTATFEGEASMALQFAAEDWAEKQQGKSPLQESSLTAASLSLPRSSTDGRFLLPTNQLFAVLLSLKQQGHPAEELAYLFHKALAAEILAGCEQAREATGCTAAALSGGVFQNTLLLRLTKDRLERAGFTVLLHSLLPPNDGGICVGQAAAAMYALQAK